MRIGIILAILLAAAGGLRAASALVEDGYDHFYNLEYPEAIADFEHAIAVAPEDPELHNHLAQALVFQEMYRDGALESELVSGNNSFLRRPKLNPAPEMERRFLGELAKAMELAQARLAKNPKDAGALYALGISHGLRSNYYWLVKKAWRDSLRDATAARLLHNRISEIEPGNVDARLVQGLDDYLVGSLPWHWRMLGMLVGIRGDKEKGVRTIQEVAKDGKENRLDAEIFLCALYRRENQTARAVPLVEDLIRRFPRNFLLRLELSQMYSMAGDGQRALEAAEEVGRLKTGHAAGYDRVPWEKIWFQEGTIQFWYRDLNGAMENLQKVAGAGESVDLNTGVQARLRIGQIYDLTGRRAQAVVEYKAAIAYAPEADAAVEARRYLGTPYKR
ncbi:MAG TPA: tetratricopeptide repeat protein [Bryobacteraceae bacterium]|nr:tetratricopeptide repeat protein [Bryobacteraceae bacterium]